MAVKNTKFIKVRVTNRNPEAEATSTYVGGNGIYINGQHEIKHYRLQLDKEVELPEPFVKQLEKRSMVGKDKNGKVKHIPLFIVERI